MQSLVIHSYKVVVRYKCGFSVVNSFVCSNCTPQAASQKLKEKFLECFHLFPSSSEYSLRFFQRLYFHTDFLSLCYFFSQKRPRGKEEKERIHPTTKLKHIPLISHLDFEPEHQMLSFNFVCVLDGSYQFKILSNLRFSFPCFPRF